MKNNPLRAMVWALLNDDIRAGVAELTASDSDRVIALLGGAIVEEQLLQSIHLRLRHSSVQQIVFKPTGGPLGGFTPKIDLRYLLHMYEKAERKALIGIAEIRNVFAHKLTIASIEAEDNGLERGLEKLTLHSRYARYPAPFWQGDSDYEVEKPTSKRETLITNIKVLLVLLMRDMYLHQAYTNFPVPLPTTKEERHALPPTSVELSGQP
jgi:hypothetical protein